MYTSEAKKASMTARQRALEVLQANPDGMSKSRLREEVGGNAGAFRRLIQSMEDKGEIVVSEEFVPHWGPTKFIRAAEPASSA